ncbi:hypothetical protein CLOM_g14422 [Closterium sp. NIES-68]|nr:hypothetical protein CLOM_g14422 [Closterium sp. NIES-68]GJP75655.1 hypothetical protein CLOP_g6079 [Closterium sp. NIES-67]
MEEDGRTAPFEASLVPYATDERRTPHGRCRRAPFHGPVARALGLNDWFSSEVWRASLIELVGTASLVFLSILGTTSCLNSSFTSPPLAIGLINGLLLTLHILAMAPASGGHVNPSITIATFFAGLTSLPRAAFYIVAQFAGSVLGAACARGVLPPVLATRYLLTGCTVSLPQLPLPPSPPLLPFVNSTSSNTSITSTPPPPFSPPSGLSIAQGLLSESIFTFALLFIAFGVALDQTQGALFGPIIAPIIIGVILSLLIFISGAIAPPGYTGVGMNPARCFGPAAAMGSEAGVLWENLWVFLVGPLLGALALGLLYNLVPPNHASVYSDPEQGMFHMFRVKAAAGAAGASGAIAAADGEAAGDGGRDGASSLLLHEKAPMLQDSLQGTGKPNLGAGSLDMRDTVQIVHE